MSKKQKMIISVTAIVLVLATVLTCVAFVIGNQNDIDRERENRNRTQTTITKRPSLQIPAIPIWTFLLSSYPMIQEMKA